MKFPYEIEISCQEFFLEKFPGSCAATAGLFVLPWGLEQNVMQT
jgi:hypothetical protein